MEPFKKLILPIIIFLGIVDIGIFGYSMIEGWPLIDSIYMVIITLFTVGFQEARPLSSAGKVFTIFLIVTGVGAAVYLAGQVIELIVEGQILGIRRRKKMEKKIRNLKDHFIICGFGRVGRQVGSEFDTAGIQYVVIDNNTELPDLYETENILHIVGDATSDETLQEAGIAAAKGLIACSDSDVANVYITLSARSLNREFLIVSRASTVDTERKLIIAGASHVISPSLISGKRMAAWATKPVASDFLDRISHGSSLEYNLQEIPVAENSLYAGKTIIESRIKENAQMTVVAIRNPDGNFNLQPDPYTVIQAGDILVAIGTKAQVKTFQGTN